MVMKMRGVRAFDCCGAAAFAHSLNTLEITLITMPTISMLQSHHYTVTESGLFFDNQKFKLSFID